MFLKSFISKEKDHLNKLSSEGRTLLFSFFLYYICDPILWTFITAYLWRQSKSITIISFYYFAVFVGLALGYFINAKLISRFKASNIYFLGMFVQGLVVVVLVFLPIINYPLVIGLGFLFGITSSFFWANKAFLSINFTHSSHRMYFSGIDIILATITAIVIPFFVGWFIVFGKNLSLYTPNSAYRLIALLVLIMLFLSGFMVRKIAFDKTDIKNHFLKNPGHDWKRIRAITYILGLVNGAEVIIPTVIVLIFVGAEGKLGTIQSGAAIISSFALYLIARKGKIEHRIMIFSLGLFFSLLSSILFAAFYSFFGVIIFFFFNSFSSSFRWTIYNPLTYDVVEKEESLENHRFTFFADQEMFLSFGRNSGIAIFLILSVVGQAISVRFTLLILALFQIPLIWVLYRLEKSMKKSYSEVLSPTVISPEGV